LKCQKQDELLDRSFTPWRLLLVAEEWGKAPEDHIWFGQINRSDSDHRHVQLSEKQALARYAVSVNAVRASEDLAGL